jgi:hypothetical protein
MPPTLQKISSAQITAPTGATSGFVLTSTGVGLTPTFQAIPASGAAQQKTLIVNLAGGAADKTTADFGFVVGQVIIEVIITAADNGSAHTVMCGTMRSFNGTKTADVTNRIIRGVGGSLSQSYVTVDRTTSGTVLNVSQVNGGSDVDITGGGIASFVTYNWPAAGRLRITAIEDTQS